MFTFSEFLFLPAPVSLCLFYSNEFSRFNKRERGLFATLETVFLFHNPYFNKISIFPYINIVNPAISEITMFAAILSLYFLIVACITMNSVIYQIYSQLNSKNNELNESLDKIVL